MDRGNEFGVLLTELLKAFECTDHKLLIPKFYCYGNSPESVKIISSYFEIERNRPKLITALVIDQKLNVALRKVQF